MNCKTNVVYLRQNVIYKIASRLQIDHEGQLKNDLWTCSQFQKITALKMFSNRFYDFQTAFYTDKKMIA